MAVYRKEAKEAAAEFVDHHFPLCQCALLAGSTVRGEATISSDLDIVIFDEQISGSYRESFKENGWPIEVFVHNFTSYQVFFKVIAAVPGHLCRRWLQKEPQSKEK